MRRKMISTQLAKFDTEGITLTGVLEVKELQFLQGKEVGRYVLKNEAATFIVNGTAQIDEAMAHAEVGQTIEILYLGSAVTGSGWTVKRFEVYILEEGEDDPAPPSANAGAAYVLPPKARRKNG